jgi:hypothetical protein
MIDQPNELETLIPEQEIEIAGLTITLHEYTFMEGMQVDAVAAPVIDGLSGIFLDRPPGEDHFPLSALAAVFGEHQEILVKMLAIASGMTKAWVRSLSDADGQLLLMTWWTVNKYFFVRRLVQEMAGLQAAQRAHERSLGESASPG